MPTTPVHGNRFLPLLLPIVLGLPGSADRLRCRPAAGTVLHKTFETHTKLELDRWTSLIDGQESTVGLFAITELDLGTKIEISDKYADVDEGGPRRIDRSYGELDCGVSLAFELIMVGERRVRLEGKSPLEWRDVRFERDAPDAAYEASFIDRVEPEPSWLVGLDPEMDLCGLLPSLEVSEKDSWAIEPDALRGLLVPGGELHFEPHVEGGKGEIHGIQVAEMSPKGLFGDLSGHVDACYRERRALKDRNLALIDLSLDLRSQKDFSSLIQGRSSSWIDPRKAELDVRLEGDGDLAWDIGANRIESLVVEGRMQVTLRISYVLNHDDGGRSTYEQRFELSGPASYSVKAEAR